MKKTYPVLIILFIIFGCKNKSPHKNEITANKVEKNNQYSHCFTLEDIKKLNNHYKELEQILKSGNDYDFKRSIVSYTEQTKKLVNRLKEKTCSFRVIDEKHNCPESISLLIDYKEVFKTDDGDHLAEETYEILLAKKTNKIFSYDTK
ncbi:hypothetical protein [Aquimarina aquimarini]|uniref:hypothetical protein n=1 Tax=Aquimarina aquimarini TaxID=1191734 RepID=UPI000D55A495|nr:hypothetical protein [Aquimarina aquimarini]